MWAAVDTPTCLRRGRLNMMLNPQPCKFLIRVLNMQTRDVLLFFSLAEYCDPLGNVNIFVPLLAANKSDGPVRNQSIIFVSARMDSASVFDGLSVGADSAITGMATLVAVAEILNKVKEDIRGTALDNVFLVLFNGEAFDYIGSSRMAYDMALGKFAFCI